MYVCVCVFLSAFIIFQFSSKRLPIVSFRKIRMLLFHCRGLGQETAEKQQPSALEFVGHFAMAMDHRERLSGKKQPLNLALNQVVSEYNKGVSVKKWRVDGNKKKLVLALLKAPVDVYNILAAHYDLHKHSLSGQAWHVWFLNQSVGPTQSRTNQ